MRNAYVNTELLVLIYLIMFTVLYFYCSSSLVNMICYVSCIVNSYMLLKFILFGGILLNNWLYTVLHVLNAMFTSVFLNKLLTLCMIGL
jgi:hypothetical protein